MNNIFANLQTESERQKARIESPKLTVIKPDKKQEEQKPKPVDKPKVVRKKLRKPLRSSVNATQANEIDKEAVELMSFKHRAIAKKRVTADIPEDWRDALFELAHEHKVGKYELIAFILGRFLGKV